MGRWEEPHLGAIPGWSGVSVLPLAGSVAMNEFLGPSEPCFPLYDGDNTYLPFERAEVSGESDET